MFVCLVTPILGWKEPLPSLRQTRRDQRHSDRAQAALGHPFLHAQMKPRYRIVCNISAYNWAFDTYTVVDADQRKSISRHDSKAEAHAAIEALEKQSNV